MDSKTYSEELTVINICSDNIVFIVSVLNVLQYLCQLVLVLCQLVFDLQKLFLGLLVFFLGLLQPLLRLLCLVWRKKKKKS